MRFALRLTAAAVAAAACRHGSSAAQQFDGRQALSWVEHQVAAGPRVPNTEAHRVIGDWLVAELRSRADTVEVQEFTHVTLDGDTLRLRNIIARFRPSDPTRILYVSHWDSRPMAEHDPNPANRNRAIPGANDGASSTALLLGVADALRRRPPPVGVDLLFTDGEDYGSDFSGPDVLLGARHFARNLPPGYQPAFGVVWDMVGAPEQRFSQEGYSLERAPEVVDRVWSRARELGLARWFPATNGGAITDDHVPLLEAGLRVIDVIGYPYEHHHTLADTPDKVSAEALARVGRLALALIY
ncbi:MAG TPA: M28 family peptidase [Gemmatimonadales bacterium]|nr:M28 family peptidase [Gemmatimonadales bacterium]